MKKLRERDKFAISLSVASIAVAALDLAYVVFAAVELALVKQGTAFFTEAFKPLTIAVIALNAALLLAFAIYFILRKIKKNY